MRGRIVKSLSGFYYVVPEESGTTVRHSAAQEWYQCRAKGVFRALKVHPLVGDELYGPRHQSSKIEGIAVSGQLLHAGTLGFVHPSSGEYMEFHSELP